MNAPRPKINMYRIKMAVVLLPSLFILLNAQSQVADMQGSRPNIIYILLDDLGYGDIGAYGGEIKTPNLDKLAKGGVKLPEMYNAGICNITRTNLMSGKYRRSIYPNSTTSLPARLKEVDYKTYMVGKSHLRDRDGNINLNEMGFDHFFGFLQGQRSMYIANNENKEESAFKEDQEFTNEFAGQYTTTASTTKALEYMNEAETEGKPFFLYMAYQAPHVPIQAPAATIAKYRGTFLRGWQEQRAERINNMKKIGVLDAGIETAPYSVIAGVDWDNLTPLQRDLEDLRMSAYAASVEEVDKSVGEILASLEADGRLENTLIVFSSDNGATASGDRRYEEDAKNLDRGVLPGDRPTGIWFTGAGWGYVSVTPFDDFKSCNYAGGTKTGAIVYWPSKIKPEDFSTNPHGAINKSLLHVVDFFPTCLDVAYPKNRAAERDVLLKDLDGASMLPLLQTEAIVIRKDPVYFNMNDDRAMRTEKWSMVENDRATGEPEDWKLFDYRYNDVTELYDLSASYPDVVKDLDKEWLRIAKRNAWNGFKSTKTFQEGTYRVLAMRENLRTTKYGYMEAVGSDHLNNTQSLSFPEKADKPLATVFRGDNLQLVGNDNIGVDGYAFGLNLSNNNLMNKLVLKEQTPSVMRLDMFSLDPQSEFIFEYVNVPRDIFVYSGDYVNDNRTDNLTGLKKAASLAALSNNSETSWYWENGSAYVKYKAPNNITFTSKKGGFANVFLCLNENCDQSDAQPILINDFEELETRSKLVNRTSINAQALVAKNGSHRYRLTDNEDGTDGCVDYELILTLQNWDGASKLNLNSTGAVGSDVFIKDKSSPNLTGLGEISENGWSSFQLDQPTNRLDEIEAVIIRTCESDFSTPNRKFRVVRLNEMTLGKFGDGVITSLNEGLILSESSDITAYPNPSETGVFSLTSDSSWEVYDLIGHLIKNGQGISVDLSAESKGVYQLVVDGQSMKLIVD